MNSLLVKFICYTGLVACIMLLGYAIGFRTASDIDDKVLTNQKSQIELLQRECKYE